MGKPVYEN